MSFSSSIQAGLEFASAALISSGFATESRGGLFPRMIVKFAALVVQSPGFRTPEGDVFVSKRQELADPHAAPAQRREQLEQ